MFDEDFIAIPSHERWQIKMNGQMHVLRNDIITMPPINKFTPVSPDNSSDGLDFEQKLKQSISNMEDLHMMIEERFLTIERSHRVFRAEAEQFSTIAMQFDAQMKLVNQRYVNQVNFVVTNIQKIYRGHLSRKRVKEVRLCKAVGKIKSYCRRFQAKRIVSYIKCNKNNSVILRGIRSYRLRKLIQRRIATRYDKRARTIQHAWHNYCRRKAESEQARLQREKMETSIKKFQQCVKKLIQRSKVEKEVRKNVSFSFGQKMYADRHVFNRDRIEMDLKKAKLSYMKRKNMRGRKDLAQLLKPRVRRNSRHSGNGIDSGLVSG